MEDLGDEQVSPDARAVSCIWDTEILQYRVEAISNLPQEALTCLQNGSNTKFLDQLAWLALDPAFTDHIFAAYKPIFVELCSRWIAHPEQALPLLIVSALARLLPYAPALSTYAHDVVFKRRAGQFAALFNQDPCSIMNLPESETICLLATLSRLLDHDRDLFGCADALPQLQMVYTHGSAAAKYLSARVIGQVLGFSETSSASIGQTAIGGEQPIANFENIEINFLFFSLWEIQRNKNMIKLLQNRRQSRHTKPAYGSGLHKEGVQIRQIVPSDLSTTTVCLAGHLILRLNKAYIAMSGLAMTASTYANMQIVAKAVTERKPVLVTGLPGSGKTMIVNEIASQLNKVQDMLTLHLNEQTDPKLLVGVYTSDSRPGSFRWQPGVLTTAVQEGRWLFIEDIDRAPTEVLAVLLPLLERNELLVSNLGGYIRAKEGFKILASKRTMLNMRGEEVVANERQLGQSVWNRVHVEPASRSDLDSIVQQRYPLLSNRPEIMQMYDALMEWNQNIVRTDRSRSATRAVGIQELFRFCSRYEALLTAKGIKTAQDPVPENLYDSILLEAVDCFCAAKEQLSERDELARLLSTKLQLSQDRTEFCLYHRAAEIRATTKHLQIGRARLGKHSSATTIDISSTSIKHQRFAPTGPVRRLMESVAVAVQMSEPCLLVGETGVGKTTVVQQLANRLGKPLTVANLSQQSEVSDLLGSIKPLSPRVIAVPLRDRFVDLFPKSPQENASFVEKVGRALRKEDWPRMIALMEKVIRQILKLLETAPKRSDESLAKKPKLAPSKRELLKAEWDELSSRLQSFKKHTLEGEKGLVFDFVEGKLVHAVKTGGWVLLDEINLATPDTLECLSDLLSHGPNTRPFLLLSEMGNVNKIEAHRDFRIFAAMNPANDVGKRDLPLSIRSRFTEFFVHSPDQDIGALKDIVSAHLSGHLKLSKYLPLSQACVDLYSKIRGLEASNQLVDGSGQRPHFTLRTLTRALTFATDTAAMYNIRSALYHGFATCFLTVLDSESRQKVASLIEEHILDGRAPAMTRTLTRPPNTESYINVENYWIRKGDLTPVTPEDYILTEHVRTNLHGLTRATLTRRYSILLQGPTSSGKTSLIEYLAKRSGNRFVRINNHEHTDLQEYLGSYTSTPEGLVYKDGVLVEALEKGHWIVLDELNLAPTDVLEALNRLLDDNRELFVPERREVITPHPNFMLFATQNPPGMYGGRKVLSRAFRNRFLELHFNDVPEDELERILKRRCPHVPESFCTRIVQVYRRLAVLRQSERMFEQKNSFATLRDLFRWALRNAENKQQLALNGFMLLGERVRDSKERLAVKKVIEEVMRETIDIDEIYKESIFSMSSSDSLELHQHGVLWTQSARRLSILVAKALEHEEPVLLVGDTGCGKTKICQVIASHQGTNLAIVNAHQNTETGDLIGSQRPIRDRSILEAKIIDLIQKLPSELSDSAPIITTVEDSLRFWDGLSEEQKRNALSAEAIAAVETARARLNLLFEWHDGSLVSAMKAGDYFLLDEISLADDSVLERLNSVLEPERSILLAEKGSIDDFVKASPSFRFLATMNPGGDYGKKELSPALRNRFTEIWVPRLSPDDDIAPIIEHKLSSGLTKFVRPMVEFSAWFAEKFRDGEKDLSIRDLIAWADFLLANCNRMESTIAFVHGGLMVYIDGLGANPSARFSATQQTIAEQRASCIKQMGFILKQELVLSEIIDLTLIQQTNQFGIGPFTVPRSLSDQELSSFNFKARTTRSNALRLLRALQLPKPILLEGSPGVGKTALVTALAGVLGHPLTRINLSDQTDIIDLFGSDVPSDGEYAGHFVWRDAPFLQAMTRGEWVLLDEMNLASQSVLEGLNACLDHRGEVFVPELGQVFKKHPGFILFAAQNPHSQGGGRKGLPASFVNRFTVVYADALDSADYSEICGSSSISRHEDAIRGMIRYTAEAQNLATSAAFQGGPWEFNLRDILRWISLTNEQGNLLASAQWTHFRHLLFSDRLRNIQDFEALWKMFVSLNDTEDGIRYLQQNMGNNWYQSGYGLVKSSGLQPSLPAHTANGYSIAVLESVMTSVQKCWPVLLTGTTGSGKSTMVLRLANLAGKQLLKVTLSPETDAFDLLGGYEQVDTTREAAGLLSTIRRSLLSQALYCFQHALVDDLGHVWLALRRTVEPSLQNVEFVAQYMDRLDKEDSPQELIDSILACKSLAQKMHREAKAQFEWVDGMLVQALRQGTWIELENANLCTSSVLDRLNALLEPGGVLTIHEHSNADGSPQQIIPHADFRLFLTMDPRHGELSRAMRNRCVEISMESGHGHLCSISSNTLPAHLFRLQAFHDLEMSSLGTLQRQELIRVIFENLAPCDFAHLRAWHDQVCRGLVSVDGCERPQLEEYFNAFESFMHADSISQVREEVSTSLRKKTGHTDRWASDQDAISFQPIHPLANPALLQETGDISPDYTWLGTVFEVTLDILCIQNTLSKISIQPGTSLSTNKSLIRQTKAIRAAVAEAVKGILVWLNESIMLRSSNEVKDSLLELCRFQARIVNLIEAPHFDKANLHTVWRLGSAFLNRLQHTHGLSELALVWSHELVQLKQGLGVSTGGSMELLWRMFKGNISSNSHALKFTKEMESLADSFDETVWRSDVSLENIVKLRNSLKVLYEDRQLSNWETQLNGLRETLEMDQTKNVYTDEPIYPHFQHEFEGISQYYFLSCTNETFSETLNTLAGRSTKESLTFNIKEPNTALVATLSRMTGIDTENSKLATINNDLPLKILRSLQSASQCNLGSLATVLEELTQLGKEVTKLSGTLARNSLKLLDAHLVGLQYSISSAHGRYLREYSLEHVNVLSALRERYNHVTSTSSTNLIDSVSFDIDQFELVLESYITPSLKALSLKENVSRKSEDLACSSFAWTRFFIALLLLYLPDVPYDPASSATMQVEIWTEAREKAYARVEALQQFEKYRTGEDTTFRLKLAKAEAARFTAPPSASNVTRPKASKISGLHAEMVTILKTVVRPVQKLFQDDPSQLETTEQSLQDAIVAKANIARAIERLERFVGDYMDMVSPLIFLLQGLAVGFELRLQAAYCAESHPTNQYASAFALSIPTPGLPHWESHSNTRDIVANQILKLKFLAAEDRSHVQDHGVFLAHIQESLESLFLLWRNQLKQERDQFASKSSLYTYKGKEAPSEESDEAELQQLFQDGTSSTLPNLSSGRLDAADVAVTVARLHNYIVEVERPLAPMLKDLVRTSAAGMVQSFESSQPKAMPSSPARLIPAVLLEISAKKQELLPHAIKASGYNFYHDFNSTETTRFRQLLFKAHARFIWLQTQWPDHAAITDVLSFCRTLLALEISQPLSNFLLKAEQLHTLINEWQTVASKEFSALESYNDLTTLLVDWRRLELSTWRKLLDFEDERCAKEAQSWWFVAYELIVHAPFYMEDEAEVDIFIANMLEELRKFISTSTCGIYCHRLELLKTFISYIEQLCVVQACLEVIVSPLHNLYNYYHRYESAAKNVISEGRKAIAKEMDEAILLASWKDTNVRALQESAKKSHRKLLKAVRKYRSLLDQPVESITLGTGGIVELRNTHIIEYGALRDAPNDILRSYLSSHMEIWQDLPKRLTDVFATTGRIEMLKLLPPITQQSEAFLSDFCNGLQEELTALRKETPNAWNEETASQVKQVKSRKKILFAETLKKLREMGFQPNVDVNSLAHQQDLAQVFLRAHKHERLAKADSPFFDFLSHMNVVRNRVKEHSEDLTHQEVNRSLGLLESILRTILTQRRAIAKTLEDADSLDAVLKRLTGLQSEHSKNGAVLSFVHTESPSNVLERINWSQALLEFAKDILEEHEQLGFQNMVDIHASLDKHMMTLSESKSLASEFVTLPSDLQTANQAKSHTAIESVIENIAIDIKDLGVQNSSIRYLMDDVSACITSGRLVAKKSGTESNAHTNNDIAVSDSSHSDTIRLVDSILKRFEKANSMAEAVSLAAGDSNWLMLTNRCFTDLARTYDLPGVTDGLDTVFKQMKHQGGARLEESAAFVSLQTPICVEFRKGIDKLLGVWAKYHEQLCSTGNLLASIFETMLTQGLCLPSEKSGEKGESGDLEAGTGLGEGEGAEDISNDIKEDEDLSELAQQKQEEDKTQELEAEKDAVDMADEDLEAQAEDADRVEDEENGENEEDADKKEVDEEVGSIDEQEDDAVDEKFWDGEKDEEQDTKTSEKQQKGTEKEEAEADGNNEGDDDGEEELDMANDEEDVVDAPSKEEQAMDQHAEQGENLDLPDNMELDGNKDDEMSDDSAGDDISDDSKDGEEDTVQQNQPEEKQEQGDEAESVDEVDMDGAQYDDEQESPEAEDDETASENALAQESNEQHDDDGETMDDVEDAGNTQGRPGEANPEEEEALSEEKNTDEMQGKDTGPDATGEEVGRSGADQDESGEAMPEPEQGSTETKEEPFKKLGDALEKWHRLNQEIQENSDPDAPEQRAEEEIGADMEFEHLPNEEAAADIQALGKAEKDQVSAFDQEAQKAGVDQEKKEHILEDDPDARSESDHAMEDILEGETLRPDATVEQESSKLVQDMMRMDPSFTGQGDMADEVSDTEMDIDTAPPESTSDFQLRSVDDARRVWSHCEGATRDLALSLTEQLRLILAPTQASKLRGDFRTGKRLNIKRIIAYIASQYKRDKIWMRRSVPSKRSYQVLLAVDDSSSMSRGGSGLLALEALALISRSLSMLEVGQICVVGFGSDVRVAHPFDQPFSSDAGVRIFQQFSFSQSKTDVRKLVDSSLDIFREARASALQGSADLWQLQLIISDGVCDDRDRIRRLVRQAQEERVMTVFVIVDAQKEESILHMQEATFVPDEYGNPRPVISRYLDSFPFSVYLIVQNVKDLPNVLATALRQWFAEVADT